MSPVRFWRVAKGMKRKEFAERVMITVGHLDNIEHNQKIPSLKLLARFAMVLDVPMEQLVRKSSGNRIAALQ